MKLLLEHRSHGCDSLYFTHKSCQGTDEVGVNGCKSGCNCYRDAGKEERREPDNDLSASQKTLFPVIPKCLWLSENVQLGDQAMAKNNCRLQAAKGRQKPTWNSLAFLWGTIKTSVTQTRCCLATAPIASNTAMHVTLLQTSSGFMRWQSITCWQHSKPLIVNQFKIIWVLFLACFKWTYSNSRWFSRNCVRCPQQLLHCLLSCGRLDSIHATCSAKRPHSMKGKEMNPAGGFHWGFHSEMYAILLQFKQNHAESTWSWVLHCAPGCFQDHSTRCKIHPQHCGERPKHALKKAVDLGQS